uniref:Uncharacterized protein n=1 Tax=Avena sativa TaxID=4498 RepID=A0ACD5U5P6_AVESA
MAEGVVGMLIAKLGVALAKETVIFGVSLFCKEVSALKGLFGEIREAKEELESMQAYLQGAERFRGTDETTGIFVKKIRGLSFEIENVVDEFTYKLEDKYGGFAAKMRKRMERVKTWRRLALKIQEIKRRLKVADERKLRYDTRGTEKNAESSGGRSMIVDQQASYFIREDFLVGIEENKKVLMQWLVEDLEQQSIVATVWGMGGVGKTTLVSHVYNVMKQGFDTAAWITVSSNYQVEAMLKIIAKELGIAGDVSSMSKRVLIEAIHTYLQGKTYILILDDVWSVDVWFSIRDAFPTGTVGRFVITSRIHEVALLATRNCIVEVEPLEDHNSWQLFCKEVFWKNQNKECPEELEHLAHMFVGKCSGLPIAIASIGRLLSCKRPTYSDWENVYKELELQLTNSVILNVNVILKVSFEHLPYDLKNCFLHCALFPEDYPIKRRRVMRQWIAAGYIRQKGNKTLEEVAEGYLTELVHRSLLKVVKWNVAGRLKCCQMHDVVRLLALSKAKEECFGRVYDGSVPFYAEGTRRISVQSVNLEQLSRSSGTRFHALHVFGRYIDIDMLKPILASSIFLSTLDLQGTRISMLPNEIFNLFNLRYLGIRNTDIRSLPEAIGRLQNLEVLDALDAKLLHLPNSIVKLQKLRYLYACTVGREAEIKPFGGVKVPNGIGRLTALQALQSVMASSEIMAEIGALTELRTFGVCNVKSEHSADLSSAINKMTNLIHLEITTRGEEVLQLEGLHLPQTLSKLGLEGQLEEKSIPRVLSSWSYLNSLTWLHLAFSKIAEESFPSLFMLSGLCTLVLTNAFEGKQLHFCAGSFPKLQFLAILDAPNLNQAEVEDGAMPSLVELVFRDCPELKFLPHGMEHLMALQKMHLIETSEELVEKLRQKNEQNECSEGLMKISKRATLRVIQNGLLETIK